MLPSLTVASIHKFIVDTNLTTKEHSKDMKHAHVIGWGHYFPPRELSNDEISEVVDTNHEWIKTRTGINSRHIVETETTTQMAFEAAVRAIAIADISPSEVDLVIVATSTPEHMFPSTASQVQALLGADNAGAFDMSAACTGFVYALDMVIIFDDAVCIIGSK